MKNGLGIWTLVFVVELKCIERKAIGQRPKTKHKDQSQSREDTSMTTLIHDIRFASRSLMKRPASTLLALMALALGIGMNTAIFSAVNSVLLRPLPFRDEDRVVAVWERGLRTDIGRNEMAPANFIDLRNQN